MVQWLKRIISIVLCCLFFHSCQDSDLRWSNTNCPYLTSGTLRSNCDFVFDESNDKIDPQRIKKGQSIYVSGSFLEKFFFKIHPMIQQPYVLVSHRVIESLPGKFFIFLNDPKILAWFAQNVDISHPKLFSLPTGVSVKKQTIEFMKEYDGAIEEKNILAYLNCILETYPSERKELYASLSKQKFVTIGKKCSAIQYMQDVVHAKFIFAPRGKGVDSHRSWDALALGCIPIIKSSGVDSLFENLPVLIIKDWKEVTEELLNQKYQEIHSKSWNLQKLYLNYWLEKIRSYAKTDSTKI